MAMGPHGGGPQHPQAPGAYGMQGGMAPQGAGFGGQLPPGGGQLPPGGGQPPPGGGSVHYEFTQVENATLSKVGSRAKWCGVICLVSGVLLTAFAVLALVAVGLELVTMNDTLSTGATILGGSVLPMALVNLVVGFFYVRAGDALRDVATTEGQDVAHMMGALARFKWAFQLEGVMAAVAMTASLTLTVVWRMLVTS